MMEFVIHQTECFVMLRIWWNQQWESFQWQQS